MSLKRISAGLALLVASSFFGTGAQAAPINGAQNTKRLIDPHAFVVRTQVFVYGGRRHCFYWDAWRGPGWYWCGYAWREGYGWGGGPGWQGRRHHSRAWHRSNRGWDRGDRRGRAERSDRRGRDWDRARGSERSSTRGRSGDREGVSGRSNRGGHSGRWNRGNDSIGRGVSSGRSGGMSGGGGRGGDGGGGRGGGRGG